MMCDIDCEKGKLANDIPRGLQRIRLARINLSAPKHLLCTTDDFGVEWGGDLSLYSIQKEVMMPHVLHSMYK